MTLTGENGLLTKAGDAKTETEIEDIIERAKIDILAAQADNNGEITEAEVSSILDAKYGTLSGEGKDQILTTDKGYVIKVSDIWNRTTSSKDVLITNPDAENKSDKSPYVSYNGLTCRVLYNDDTHGLQIITSESVETVDLGYNDSMVTSSDFLYKGSASVSENFLKAAASYNNVVDNLNNKAKTYMDSKGIARDARCLGSKPTLNSELKFQGDTSGMWSFDEEYMTTYNWNDKFKDSSMDCIADVNQLRNLGLNVEGYTWVATRSIVASQITYFNVNRVNSWGHTAGNSCHLCQITSNGYTQGYSNSGGFRPVFLLPSDVVINSGDGSYENPYVIE